MTQDDFDVITGPSTELAARRIEAEQIQSERKPRQAPAPEREAGQKAA